MTELIDTLTQINHQLVRLEPLIKKRRNLMNQIVDATVVYTSDEYSNIQFQSRLLRGHIKALSDEFLGGAETRVVGGDGGTGDHDGLDALSRLPDALQRSYESLVRTTYGSPGIGALSHANTNDEKAPGKGVEWRVSTSKENTGRAASSPKKFGGKKAVVKNERAFAFKQEIDRKLRKIRREIEVYLGGETSDYHERVCTKCRKFGDPRWKYCPRCGAPMEDR